MYVICNVISQIFEPLLQMKVIDAIQAQFNCEWWKWPIMWIIWILIEI